MTRVIGSQSDVPDVGDPIVSPWYQDTSGKLVHRFATKAALDAWTSPPAGACAWVGPLTGTAGSFGLDFRYLGGSWWPRGFVVQGVATADQTLSADATWIDVNYSASGRNVGGGWATPVFTAPYTGDVRITASTTVVVSTTAGGSPDAPGVYQLNFAADLGGTKYQFGQHSGTGASFTISGSVVLHVTAANTIRPQVWLNGAAGKFKRLVASPSNHVGLQIEYV